MCNNDAIRNNRILVTILNDKETEILIIAMMVVTIAIVEIKTALIQITTTIMVTMVNGKMKHYKES